MPVISSKRTRRSLYVMQGERHVRMDVQEGPRRALEGSKDQDVKAWLLIGAIFVGTLLVVWLPVVIAAMHATNS